MIKLYKYETNNLTRTFDSYNDVDSYVYMDLHDLIKDFKYGYTKVLDHACREIRLGHITRNNAIKLVKHYHSKKPKYILDEIRNPEIWERNKHWEWVKKFNLVPNYDKTQKDKGFKTFVVTKRYKSSDTNKKYIIIGKGERQ